jgi:RNA polymerase sigma-70 factor (ECF subfamily)
METISDIQSCNLGHGKAKKYGMVETLAVKPSDDGLVALARKGDHGAFEELVDRYKQKAYRIAFDFARDRDEAKDLSQEAFLRAFTHLKNFDGRSGFYTWFYRILVNICLDYRRRKHRASTEEFNEKIENQAEPSQPAATSVSPDEQASARQFSRRVGVALATLPPKQRTAFILKNHQGMSIREIAEMMQTAEGTVKVHLHRAVVALRKSLAEFA